MTPDEPTIRNATPEGFCINDASSANWVVRKIVEARAYAQRVKAWAELEQRRAERDEQFLLHRFGVQLEDWARRQIAIQHDGRRSTSLPSSARSTFRNSHARPSSIPPPTTSDSVYSKTQPTKSSKILTPSADSFTSPPPALTEA